MSPRARTAVAPFLLLVAVDLVAVATLARCFSGPGELAYALPTCGVAQLLAGGIRRIGAHRIRVGRAASLAGVALALLVTVYLPFAAVDWHHFTAGLPLAPAWHAARLQLQQAWRIFSFRIAPVSEVPGLILITSWAAGVVAVAAEVLYADVGLPAVVALVPAFDIIVFVGALGTSGGRAAETAVVAGLALVFLASAQADGAPRRVVVAKVEGDGAGTGLPTARRTRGLALPGVAVAAALAAGFVGPLLPGATSAPLIAWHSDRARPGAGGNVPRAGGPIVVSNLVQAAEGEIDDPDTLLLRVHSAVRADELLFTLDRFNGERWTNSSPLWRRPLPAAGVELPRDGDMRPRPRVVAGPRGERVVTEVVRNVALAGREVPSPGRPLALRGFTAFRTGAGIVAPSGFGPGSSYTIAAAIPTKNPALLSSATITGAPRRDLFLPGPVPDRLRRLAARIIARSTSPYGAAEALEDYFLSGHSFSYRLPAQAPSGAIADTSADYRALSNFLFVTKSGYCQQYATAFAVLGRLARLPTRVAVGFLPGSEAGHEVYDITGSDVHAWAQVFLGRFGWVSFDPTPGSTLSGRGGPQPHRRTSPSTVPTTTSPFHLHFHLFHHTAPASGGTKHTTGSRGHTGRTSPSGSGVLSILLVLLGVLVLWCGGVPLLRSLARRRERADPRRAAAAGWASALFALGALGVHRRRSETRTEFVQRVVERRVLTTGAAAALSRLAETVDRANFGRPVVPGPSVASAEAGAAVADARIVRHAVLRQLAPLRRAALLLDPRDLLLAPF